MAAPLRTFPSQKYKQIAFGLINGDEAPVYHKMLIRPEELSLTDPSRLTVQQTLGGAWADNFGTGIQSITIAGNTGWQLNELDSQEISLGVTRFDDLYETAYLAWHRFREEAINAGKDPATVKLIFFDELDEICAEVAPVSFILRRHKTRPLLQMYTIQLTVLNRQAGEKLTPNDDQYNDIPEPEAQMDALVDSIETIEKAEKEQLSWIGKALGIPSMNFLIKSQELLKDVTDRVNAVKGAIDKPLAELIGVASNFAQAGRNLYAAIASVASIKPHIKARLMELSSAFSTIMCVLRSLGRAAKQYPQYSDLYGASNCSSTVGGHTLSPLRDQNPFAVMPATSQVGTPSGISTSSAGALSAANNMDWIGYTRSAGPAALPVIGSTFNALSAE
jgi:hypothetical protein